MASANWASEEKGPGSEQLLNLERNHEISHGHGNLPIGPTCLPKLREPFFIPGFLLQTLQSQKDAAGAVFKPLADAPLHHRLVVFGAEAALPLHSRAFGGRTRQ